MASGCDPFESLLTNAIHAISDSLSHLESELRLAAKELEPHSPHHPRDGPLSLQLRSKFHGSIMGILKSEKADAGGLVSSVRFARMRGAATSLVEITSTAKIAVDEETSENGSPQKHVDSLCETTFSDAGNVSSVAVSSEPAESVLKSALAGGLACAFSAALMHPVDTMKTHVQTSTLSFPQLVSKLPQIGLQGLYKGSIPAIVGQFSGHGLRMGIFEASKLILINSAPILPEIQVHSLASFCSTFLGTAARIPAEVLKQRLQASLFKNVGEAIVGTMREDGIKGFFRGTKVTLLREVPFYVAGTGVYEAAKMAAQKLLRRDLEPWETILVGALSGGLTAVATTPLDVVKTRMMTAPQGLSLSMSMVAWTILRDEGPLSLYKGAVPRFFWVAPLGAMNFAGYELIRKAMDRM